MFFRFTPHIVFLYIVVVLLSIVTSLYYFNRSATLRVAEEAARTYMTTLSTVHRYYSKEIVDRALAGGATFAPDYKSYPDRIPFPGTVAMDLGDELEAVDPNLNFSLYSRHPFPWNMERVLDRFERDSLDRFEDGRAETHIQLADLNGRRIIRYAVAVRMKPHCVECHNRPEFANGLVWQVGDLRGARQVSLPFPGPTSFPRSSTSSSSAPASWSAARAWGWCGPSFGAWKEPIGRGPRISSS